jgi:hypothetical protein
LPIQENTELLLEFKNRNEALGGVSAKLAALLHVVLVYEVGSRVVGRHRRPSKNLQGINISLGNVAKASMRDLCWSRKWGHVAEDTFDRHCIRERCAVLVYQSGFD